MTTPPGSPTFGASWLRTLDPDAEWDDDVENETIPHVFGAGMKRATHDDSSPYRQRRARKVAPLSPQSSSTSNAAGGARTVAPLSPQSSSTSNAAGGASSIAATALQTTPTSSPSKEKNEVTPPVRRFISIAPTPGFRAPDGPPFEGTKAPVENDLHPPALSNGLGTELCYTDAEGTKRTLLQQPTGSKSCWAYSLAMLLTDLIRSDHTIQLNDSFWQWFSKAYLLTGDTVQTEMKKHGLQLEKTTITKENVIAHIKQKIASSGFPVLVAMNHKIFSGHVVVVDKITDTHTVLRDPYSGEAWIITNEEMKTHFGSWGNSCLSVTPQ